jgi:hypothetical protein
MQLCMYIVNTLLGQKVIRRATVAVRVFCAVLDKIAIYQVIPALTAASIALITPVV